MLIAHGATLFANLSTQEVTLALKPKQGGDAKMGNYLQSRESKQDVDFVNLSWALDSILGNSAEFPEFEYYLFKTAETEEQLLQDCDGFGDRYEDNTDTRSLKRSFDEHMKGHVQDQTRTKLARRHLSAVCEDKAMHRNDAMDWKAAISNGDLQLSDEELICMDTKFTIFWRNSLVIFVDCHASLGPLEPRDSPTG